MEARERKEREREEKGGIPNIGRLGFSLEMAGPRDIGTCVLVAVRVCCSY
jgi:hypothetical protein